MENLASTFSDQNLQQTIPFLQARRRRRRPLCLRSALAILTGLPVHSPCNLRIQKPGIMPCPSKQGHLRDGWDEYVESFDLHWKRKGPGAAVRPERDAARTRWMAARHRHWAWHYTATRDVRFVVVGVLIADASCCWFRAFIVRASYAVLLVRVTMWFLVLPPICIARLSTFKQK